MDFSDNFCVMDLLQHCLTDIMLVPEIGSDSEGQNSDTNISDNDLDKSWDDYTNEIMVFIMFIYAVQ